MKTILCSTLFLASALAFAAEAPAPATPDAKPAGEAKPARAAGCLSSTGSHLPVKDGQCVNAAGHVITREELDHTGQTNLAKAISQLHPSATSNVP